MKRILPSLLAILMLMTAVPSPVSAAEAAVVVQPATGAAFSYSEALAGYSLPVYAGEDITVQTERILVTGDSFAVSAEAPADGVYEIWVEYRGGAGQILPVELSMRVDGGQPFGELRRLKFKSLWQNLTPPLIDRFGNELPPGLTVSDDRLVEPLEDSSRRLSEPLLFELREGRRTFEFTVTDGRIDVFNVILRAPRRIPAYAGGAATGNALVTVMGQDFASANNSSIRAGAEYNASLTPYSASSRVLNFLDDASFARAGDRVDYQVEIPSDGYYQIDFIYRQAAKSNFPVFLDILIDEELPSEAARAIPFGFERNFTQYTAPAADGSPQVFWLEKGTRIISLEINADPLAPVYAGVDKLLLEISDLTTEIIRLTGGEHADPFRDYRLSEYLPNLQNTLLSWARECDQMVEYSLAYSGGRLSGVFSSLNLCADMLRRLAKKHEDLPRRLSELSKGPSSVMRYLAQTIEDMDNHALGVDMFHVYQNGAELPKRPGFFTVVIENIKRFFISFTRKDYETSGGQSDHLQVWMARPRQYVELLQNMIDTEFTPATGIKVDVSIMPDQSKLALAAAAGEAPDVALSVGYVLPSYLNIRGALLDLKQFDDFCDVAERFPSGLFVPGIYDGGVYAIPETINFWVLFYRSDIFGALGLPVPDSIDDVKAILPELQRRSMNFYYPTAGMIGMKIFPGTLPLILQSGGGFFGDTIWSTTLDSDASLAGFRELTDLFTVYDIPIEIPAPGFYQEFRNGSLPIGIADVSNYNLLMNSAPELDGSWAIAPFPGMKDADGNVLRYATGGAESDIIFSTTERPDDSWRFLEWWSRGDTQARYGISLSSLYGGAFFWNTANKDAFAQLPIPSEHKSVILAQTDWMVEAPWVPGTYMVERELSNAYNSVVVDGVTVRRALDTAVKRIDREVFRKLEEFGYTQNGVSVRDFKTPDISVLERRR